MSRRSKCDAPVVIEVKDTTAGQPQLSNLLSNDNVIAFAPGVIIDTAVVASNQEFTSSQPPAGTASGQISSDRVREAVSNCLRRQELK